MCGICGFLETRGDDASRGAAHAAIRRMADSLAHRGPDDCGFWLDSSAGVALGHRRLSILDLSPLGHQPMLSRAERFAITFNGEIYNFSELRSELEQAHCGPAPLFRGHSDTEVMLAAFEAWGVSRATARFNGMFAFAVWDRKERVLYLGRDRFGEKPLYYGKAGDTFYFASELKAILAHPRFEGRVDHQALKLFFHLSYIPTPRTIFQGLKKLPPGCLLTVPGDLQGNPSPIPYWSLHDAVEAALRSPFSGSPEEAVDRTEALLKDSVKMRMISDVPLGGLFSGGLDSTTVVALMQAQSSKPVRTFTIGYQEAGYNEASYAQAIAKHLGTEHTDLYVGTKEAMAVIPKLPAMYDEPFADSSQIPTFLVCEMARKYVTVALSGDGGDEVFGGYNRHYWGPVFWRWIKPIPLPVRRGLSALGGFVPDVLLQAGFKMMRPFLPKAMRSLDMDGKYHRALEVMRVDGPLSLYREFIQSWRESDDLLENTILPPTLLDDPYQLIPDLDPGAMMMYYDTVTYLPDDILVKVDRASMAVSLETRPPILDHRLVEFAWTLPPMSRSRRASRNGFCGKFWNAMFLPVLRKDPRRDLAFRWVSGCATN